MPDVSRVLVVSTSRGDARGLSVVARELVAAGLDAVALVTEAAGPGWEWLKPPARPAITVAETGLRPGVDATALVAGAQALARAAQPMLARRVDLLMLMGDRHELLPLLQVAVTEQVPIAHLSGGEITSGASDDAIRHAVTKLAHVHFCSAEGAARRLRQMGEEDWRIHVTGDPGLDMLRADADAIDQRSLFRELGLSPAGPVALLTYHPPTGNQERLDAELEACFEAAGAFATVIATHPSAEPGADRVLEALHRWAGARPGATVVPQLGRLYAPLLARVDAVIGNSSSGIVEAASFACPVIDVGDRQRGRDHGANVVHVAGRPGLAGPAARRVLDPTFRVALEGMTNPYGNGEAARRIARITAKLPRGRLWVKEFVDLPTASA